ncbi:MAG: hypothetical protein KatS3mg105_1447 [Gemmatales bacterium]|nr:MAG: hypothetical protein KatS3mg105_1447 [Gemmatales bacterium]
MAEANQAIIAASQEQPHNSRMGTTAVMALERQGRVFVASLGDSRAYLVRGDEVHLLTIDHSVAQELVNHGVLSESEAKHSPLQHVLYRFLGCTQMDERTDVVQFAPEPGDLLLLASDGLTNYIDENDLRRIRHCPDPQNGCEQLVQLSLDRGSSDNVTCILVAFEAKDDE